MDPSNYPRPDYPVSSVHSKDKGWGIAIMVLASLGVCCGLSVAGLGGLLGVAGVGTAAAGGTNRSAAAGLGLGGGLIAIVGFAILAASAAQVAGGFGIMNSRRWGFVLTLVFAGLSILANLPGIVHGTGIVGIVLNGVIAWYCWSRLSGKDGPTPV